MNTNSTQQEYEFDIVPYQKLFYKNDYGIYKVLTQDDIPYFESINSTTKMGTIVGNMPILVENQKYRVRGILEFNKRYGSWQYKVIAISSNIPVTTDEQMFFLKSIITDRQANILLSVYPNIVQDTINKTDNIDLKKLKGIGEKTWKKIKEKIITNFVLSDLITLLAPAGISMRTILRLVGNTQDIKSLKEKLINNPYILTNIKGLGFKRIDAIAFKINPNIKDSKLRAMSCIKYILQDRGNSFGHTWITIEEMKEYFNELAPECANHIENILEEEELNPQTFIIRDDSIGLLNRYNKEVYIVNKLKIMNKNTIPINEENIQKGIEIANQSQQYNYDDDQLKIIRNIVNGSNVQVLRGHAGTGKTAIARGILNIFRAQGLTIIATSLSAKASVRITEATGFESQTIHRTLGARDLDDFQYNELCPLSTDILLVDECSMLNGNIFEKLLRATPPTTKLILIGDDKQLPPIGWGNIFGDLIIKNDKEICQVNKLTKIYRTASNSGILIDANEIRENRSPLIKIVGQTVHGINKDMNYKFIKDKEDIFNDAFDLYKELVEEHGVENVVVLVPRKENCVNSTAHYNELIQNYLLGDNVKSIVIGKKTFKQGCRVIHRKNNYDLNIMNGEIGTIKTITNDGCIVEYKDKQVSYDYEDMKELDYAYALTPHLYQGSECEYVIGVIDKSHYTLLDSTLLYTLITRARIKCYLYSDNFAFGQCIRTNKSIYKQTYLSLKNIDYKEIKDYTNSDILLEEE